MFSIPAQLTTAYRTYDEGDDIVCSCMATYSWGKSRDEINDFI